MIYTVTLNPSIDYIVHLPAIELGEVNRIQQDFKLPGGKGINVSRILNELEVKTPLWDSLAVLPENTSKTGLKQKTAKRTLRMWMKQPASMSRSSQEWRRK